MIRLFSYVLTCDSGFAPHVDKEGKFLTLCTCMVRIRAKAHEGDWVLGTVGKTLNRADHRKVVYLAKVTEEPFSFKEYWQDKRFLGRKDRVYKPVDHIDPVTKKQYQSTGWNEHKEPKQQQDDLSVDRVLISNHFYYFGNAPQKLNNRLEGFIVSPRYSDRFPGEKIDELIQFADRSWKDHLNKWSPPTTISNKSRVCT